MDYQLDITYGNLSDLPGGDQDDANSGGDAGSSFGSSVDIAAYMDTDADGTCDAVDPDDDGDGVPDVNDVYPKDGTEWEDRNSDGLGDNAHPLSIVDQINEAILTLEEGVAEPAAIDIEAQAITIGGLSPVNQERFLSFQPHPDCTN